MNLEAKLSRNVGVLFKLNKYLPTCALITLYYPLVHPFLFYGISVWGSTNKTFFTKLRSMQNKALKAIGRLGWPTSPKHLYNRFKILKLGDVYKTELSKFVHRVMSKNTPKYFDNYNTEFQEFNKHNTTSSSHKNLMLPLYRLTIRPGLAGTVPVLTPCPGVPIGRSKCPGNLDHNSCDIYGAPFEKNYAFCEPCFWNLQLKKHGSQNV